MAETDDDELAARIARGDHAAFRVLVDRHGASLYRLAARLVGEAEADDVVQRALTKAYVALCAGRYDESGQLAPWLARVAARVALDELRSAKRRRAREAVSGLTARQSPERGTARVALRELAALLDRLPATQRVALVLKQVEGSSTREIAAAMGCSEGAVEQRLVRARAALRASLDEDPGGGT